MMKKIIFTLVLLFSVSICYGGNVDTCGIGSKATALGGAFSAYADDPFAAYYNPAGLSQIDHIMISGGVQMLDPSLNIYDYQISGVAGSTDISDTSDNLFVPHFGVAYPISDKIVAGLAVYVPYGLDIQWDGNAAANPAAYDCTRSYYFREVVTPSFSYKFNDKFAVGLGISLGKSETGVERNSYAANKLYGRDVKTETELKDDFNYSYNIGAMFKPIETVTLGLTYRSRTDTDFEGNLTVTGLTAAPVALDAETSIDHPEQIQAGIRYQPHEKLSLEFDYVWTNWSLIDRYIVNLTPGPTAMALLGKQRETFERQWNDTTQIRFGVEWAVNRLLVLRAGYFYDPSPIEDNTFDIQWPDADKKTYSAGLGLNFDRWSIDAVFQYAMVESERQIGGESETLNDAYTVVSTPDISMSADGNIWGIGLTFNYSI
ncbi:MAG: outer membrane protein transport protein [Desulfobacterales bacterium]|nr:outer membrane protein transport protein [Desulfobacterales bacterium]MDD4072990.1 outer membrane protein transport protein [Desulfobacterales bacterium]MDD4392858.1 outer membrane protein transport protein [Desulfobacterales bacterium]